MPYEHDIFVSYRRHPETLAWIRTHFLPLLQLRVGLALGRDIDVYTHEVTALIPAGANWPLQLAKKIACSRVLVALWSRQYLNSVWCAQEFAHMLGREEECGGRGKNEYGLVIPAIVHDGDTFPDDLSYIQRLDLNCCFNTRMRVDSEKAEQLSELLATHSDGIAAAIDAAPEWRDPWSATAAEQFFQKYYELHPSSQTRPPRFAA